jgi:hypothetical protein
VRGHFGIGPAKDRHELRLGRAGVRCAGCGDLANTMRGAGNAGDFASVPKLGAKAFLGERAVR